MISFFFSFFSFLSSFPLVCSPHRFFSNNSISNCGHPSLSPSLLHTFAFFHCASLSLVFLRRLPRFIFIRRYRSSFCSGGSPSFFLPYR